MKYLSFLFVLTSWLLISCGAINPPNKRDAPKTNLPLGKLTLPEGFEISIYAEGVVNARSLCLSPSGTLFVGTRGQGDVYALQDKDGDGYAETKFVLATKLKMPNGVAFRNGSLYVAEVNRILRYDDIEANLAAPPEPVVVFDEYPSETHHGWKYIAFGPDDKLYVPVGAPCNICERDEPIFSTITRIDPDGKNFEIVQKGIRNSVGFNWHPETKELWFTDNGRDWLGDDSPACELNHASKDGLHFGFPYCHQGDLPDEKFGEERDCSEFVPPVQKLGPHVAPLGLEFVQSKQFPKKYRGQILLAEHGSWNRSTKIGYQISLVTLDGDQATSYEPFIKGWLELGAEDEVWGRPVDLEWMPDGSLLISDDFADAIYRVTYP
ncbi:MAG: sorbosone dehydrogenase family protein [Phaeodactylibacter sp.]|nr:sorbosone dehydrogenase family protein [Phaeodactylibacter sp.]